jgi:hypothetical protein
MHLKDKIAKKEAQIGIIGRGYVGLPLVLAFCGPDTGARGRLQAELRFLRPCPDGLYCHLRPHSSQQEPRSGHDIRIRHRTDDCRLPP